MSRALSRSTGKIYMCLEMQDSPVYNLVSSGEEGDVTCDDLFRTKSPSEERWLAREKPTEEELSWNRSLRVSGAISDAVRSARRPVLFTVTSTAFMYSSVYWYAWWPPTADESLGRDVLKTFLLTRTAQRYRRDDDLSIHHALTKAFIQVLSSPPQPDTTTTTTEYQESVALLRHYFGTLDLGQVRHVYFYEDAEHFSHSVYSETLDDNLPVYHWQM